MKRIPPDLRGDLAPSAVAVLNAKITYLAILTSMTSGDEDVDQALNDFYEYYGQHGTLRPDPYIGQSTVITLLAGIARRLTRIEGLLADPGSFKD